MKIQHTGVVRLDAQEIERRRLALGMLKGELARKTEFSYPSISAALNGKPVGVRVARAVAQVLGVKVSRLLLRRGRSAGDGSAVGVVKRSASKPGDGSLGKLNWGVDEL